MLSLIADPRLLEPDPPLAQIIDLTRACVTSSDLDFMFPELSHVTGATWRVPVDAARALLFDWVEEFGPVNIRLE